MTKLENQMGRWGAVSYIVGNIVGSGIFIVPGIVLKNSGSVGLSLIIWLFSAFFAIVGAYCYIELGTSIRKSGGDFAYLTHVRWNAIAFMFMMGACILTLPLTIAIQAETFSEYFLQSLNIKICSSEFLKLFLKKFIGYGLCWLLLFINFFSLRTNAARFQIICSSAKLLAVCLIIGIGFYVFIFKENIKANFSQPFANSNWESSFIVNALFASLFSYDGWDILNFGAEEVSNLKQTMSFAMPVGIILVAFLYMAVNLAFFVVIPIEEIKDSAAIATIFAKHSMGIIEPLIPILVCVMLIGSLNSTLFVASRYMLAAASKRQLPTFLFCINYLHDSPRVALLFQVILAICFSFLNSLDKLISYVSFVVWAQRLFTICALIKIKLFNPKGLPPINSEAIKNSLLFPFIFLIIALFLVGNTIFKDFSTSAIGLCILGFALILYFLFLWERSPLLKSKKYLRISNKINEKLFIFVQIIFNGKQVNFEEYKEEIKKYLKTRRMKIYYGE
uniref:Uncharacterized protein n=1 Tax=Meloidogyne enterolobii TaxID=390850 RepID=A0A6V7V3M1_MELEN|nr:unnamed protein product [Meloidogyne enterolobii]